jgi:MFS transporter, Spinster family, sphingosine-1-phosphate transporter
MNRHPSRHRWFVVGVFFTFMLLHQSDRLLIGSLTTNIMATFHITMTQMGAISTGALIVGAICYPLWGYLYDRYGRAKLLAAASFIWGATTWLNAIAPTYRTFLFTRASTGIDDSSYPGLYSLVADYFGPKVRGKIYGFLSLTMPLGFLSGMVMALMLRDRIGWRGVFYITGSLGVVLAAVIFFFVKEPPRGKTEPELAGLEAVGTYRISWVAVKALFNKPTLRLLFIQGFFGVFPWNVITYWFLVYLEKERGYTGDSLMLTMGVAVIILALGYPLGGAVGDFFFHRNPRGRVIVATAGVIIGAIFMWITMSVPIASTGLFMLMLSLTAIFIPFASSNVIATVFDVTLPEVRSTAQAIQSFIESAGAALSPLIAGMIADRSSLHDAILLICVSTWILCAIFFAFVARSVPHDIAVLRGQLRERAERERALQAPGGDVVVEGKWVAGTQGQSI